MERKLDGGEYLFFHKIDTKEKAYILGLMASDGGIETKGNRIYINMKDDIDNNILLEKVLKTIGLGTISRSSYYDHKYEVIRKEVRWRVCSKQMKQDLIHKGIVPCKSSVDMSSVFNYIPENLVSCFIRGYIDGDGDVFAEDFSTCLYPRDPAIGITGNVKNFLEELKRIICKNTGASSKCNVIHCKNSFYIKWTGDDSVIKIRDWIYDGEDTYLCLERKRATLFLAKRVKGIKRPQSKYIGVQWSRKSGKWSVRPYYAIDNKRHVYGEYINDYDAALDREIGIVRGVLKGRRNFKYSIKELREEKRRIGETQKNIPESYVVEV